MNRIGYVVIEWNQDDRQPMIHGLGDLHPDESYARQVAANAHDQAQAIGHREGYTIAEVIEVMP